ncbi:MAG: hypothetical protein H8D80_01725 [Proteobacteria bacterium]|nr:hypothetical protein [Pseudomonadota bacterium]
MKNYNTFISEQREILLEKGKDPTTTMSAQITGLGDFSSASDIVVPKGSVNMGFDRNYDTAHDFKNLIKSMPNLWKDYNEAEFLSLLDNMKENERVKLQKQINSVQNFNDPKAIKNIKTSLTRADIMNNVDSVFIPANGYSKFGR